MQACVRIYHLPHKHTRMTVVTVVTLDGGDIVIPFPDNMPITTGDLVRELAKRVPNHRSTFLLCVNDSECPVKGGAPDADLTTVVVDTTKDVTLLFQPYEAFVTNSELISAVGKWVAGGERKAVVSERYGHRIGEWDVSRVTDMSKLFYHSTIDDDLSGWDTSNVTNMDGMFTRAEAFNGDVSGWDTSSVTNMRYMFFGAVRFNGDVSGWDTSSVTDTSRMFAGNRAFDGDVSGWDTSNVTNMWGMFGDTNTFNGDVSGWDTSNVTDMECLFSNATAFNGDVSSWDTSNVTDMRQMFSGATVFNGDVRGWDTSNVAADNRM
jgi:surface protein